MSKKQKDLFEIPAELPRPERKKLPSKPRKLTLKERAEELREQYLRAREEKQRRREEARHQQPTLDQLEKELLRVRRQRRHFNIWRNTTLVLAVLIALAAAALLVFPIARVQGADMANTLYDGDWIAAVRTETVSRGDLVLFTAGNQMLVRRVIALEGDTVDIAEDGLVLVNGQVIEEEYAPEMLRGECQTAFPCIVPAGRLFVLSDDRRSTVDSRFDYPGMIVWEQLVGRVAARLLPIENAQRIR